ncbi:MAG: hypothetical protein ABL920_00085 [Methylotenera sp.]
MYSTEEEALILYFLNEGQPLINSSIPRMLSNVLEESDFSSTTPNNNLTSLEKASNGLETFPELDALTVKLEETSSPEWFKEWRVSIEDWDATTKECFSATLQNLDQDEFSRVGCLRL